MSIEAMKQALEALTRIWEDGLENFPESAHDSAITALRTAIEQAEFDAAHESLEKQAGIHVSQQSAEKQEPVAWSVTWDGVHCGNFFFREGDAIEQRERLSLKFPNEKREVVPLYTTPPAAPVQERNFCERCGKRLNDGRIHTCTPPEAPRQWIGLTEEEHTQIAVDAGCMSSDWVFYGAAVERALKEKNK